MPGASAARQHLRSVRKATPPERMLRCLWQCDLSVRSAIVCALQGGCQGPACGATATAFLCGLRVCFSPALPCQCPWEGFGQMPRLQFFDSSLLRFFAFGQSAGHAMASRTWALPSRQKAQRTRGLGNVLALGQRTGLEPIHAINASNAACNGRRNTSAHIGTAGKSPGCCSM